MTGRNGQRPGAAGALMLAVVAAAGVGTGIASLEAASRPEGPAPSQLLALLPDGEEKRRFILDCTGCHQLTEGVVKPAGVLRTREGWRERIAQMLSFAGPGTGFPIISPHADADRMSAWLAEHLGEGTPAPPPAVEEVAGAVVREYALPVAAELPHDVMLDPAGRVVVTGMATGAMWVLDPAAGSYERVAIPRAQANPRALHVAESGDWWVLLGFPRTLAHRSPAGEWAFHPLGVYPHSVALDRDGGVWYNDHFARDSTLIFRLDPATGETRRFAIAPPEGWTPASGTTIPYGLRIGPDGRDTPLRCNPVRSARLALVATGFAYGVEFFTA